MSEAKSELQETIEKIKISLEKLQQRKFVYEQMQLCLESWDGRKLTSKIEAQLKEQIPSYNVSYFKDGTDRVIYVAKKQFSERVIVQSVNIRDEFDFVKYRDGKSGIIDTAFETIVNYQFLLNNPDIIEAYIEGLHRLEVAIAEAKDLLDTKMVRYLPYNLPYNLEQFVKKHF